MNLLRACMLITRLFRPNKEHRGGYPFKMNTNKALLIIDVQASMFDESDPVYEGQQLLARLQKLISSARTSGVQLVYVQHNEGPGQPLEPGTPGWEIHPAIAPEEGDIVVQKRKPDAFQETDLQQRLAEQGIKELILAGIQTEVCVDTTCRRAFSLGYDVKLVKDAHSTWNTSELTAAQVINHHNQTLRWFARMVSSEDAVF